MRERLAELGQQVEFGCELIEFEQGENGVTARLAGPNGEKTVRARYLVGADGGRSFVRSALGVEFPGKTLGVRAIVADVMLTGLNRDAWHQFNDGDMERMAAICPLAGTDLFQISGAYSARGRSRSVGRRNSAITRRADWPQRCSGAFGSLGVGLRDERPACRSLPG